MERLEAELDRARNLSVADLADAVEAVGFECTRCGACCKGYVDGCGDGEEGDGGDGEGDPHTATVFPDEVRRLRAAATDADDPALADAYDWRDVARPMPYGLREGGGETFEWALATDDCGDCTFYDETDGEGRCAVHDDRPLVCRTYPFSLSGVDECQHTDDGGLGTTEPMGGVVEQEGMVRAHECEGLGRDISREEAEELAEALKERAIRELEEAIGVRDNYQPTDADGVVVHDSEGQKRPDGTPLEDGE